MSYNVMQGAQAKEDSLTKLNDLLKGANGGPESEKLIKDFMNVISAATGLQEASTKKEPKQLDPEIEKEFKELRQEIENSLKKIILDNTKSEKIQDDQAFVELDAHIQVLECNFVKTLESNPNAVIEIDLSIVPALVKLNYTNTLEQFNVDYLNNVRPTYKKFHKLLNHNMDTLGNSYYNAINVISGLSNLVKELGFRP